jgi:NADH dehydrogenase (ubiquinone) 1 alpha subcomplex subunit 5
MKASTGITGLEAHPDPLPALKQTYTSTLNLLGSLPSTSVYRQATEALTQHRLQTVESSGEDVAKFESSLGSMAEVILEEAKAEQMLIGKMIEWKG